MSALFVRLIDRLRHYRQPAQGLVEYALILVLISIVAITVMTIVGNQINAIFQTAGNALVAP